MHLYRLILLALLIGLGTRGLAQTVNPERPPEVLAQKIPSAKDMAARANDVQWQKDLKELSELSAGLAPDLDQLKQGVVQKDLADKLKRLEKLCKRLREGLTK
jgi:hypothetical protein